MTSILSEELKNDFFIRLYFNINKGYYKAGLRRAYLDFNRTLKIKDGNKENRILKLEATENFLETEIKKLLTLKFKNQEDFDKAHKKLCNNLINEWNELSVGQAQKWINMALKYFIVFGEKHISNINTNAHFFHIPLDSYVQKGMYEEKNPKPWSKIKDYDTEYMEYQLIHRNKQTGNPPLLDEFIFFNTTND